MSNFFTDFDINLVVVAVGGVVGGVVGGGRWWWSPWCNDFDINLLRFSAPASACAAITMPHRVILCCSI